MGAVSLSSAIFTYIVVGASNIEGKEIGNFEPTLMKEGQSKEKKKNVEKERKWRKRKKASEENKEDEEKKENGEKKNDKSKRKTDSSVDINRPKMELLTIDKLLVINLKRWT